MARKIRKQLYIDRRHDQRLKDLARHTGRSEADIVREAVEQYHAAAPRAMPLDPGAWLEALAFMRSLSTRRSAGRQQRVSRERIHEEGLTSRGQRPR